MLRSLVIVLLLVSVPGATEATTPDPFPRPASLEPAIAFWKQVFSVWDEDQVAFLDGKNLGRVYAVRRLPPDTGTAARNKERETLRARWKDEIQEDLKLLGSQGVDFTALEGSTARIFEICGRNTDPAFYAAAVENLRGQRGIKTRFMNGVCQSARYIEAFREIFREENVPEALAYLPHVESSYQWDAQSFAGALGMWQFMSPAARKYQLTITDGVDTRLDPHAAARAAAGYMRDAYTELGTWPLAITSYNHGVEGIKRAVRATGTTDIARIIETYEGSMFGYAGRNFYPEFLAARELADSLLADPGDLPLLEPIPTEDFVLPGYVKLSTVADALQVNPDDLVKCNPAVTRAARRGEAYLPKGYVLRLPEQRVQDPNALFASIPEKDRPITEPRRTYKVRSGDSLGTIARKHSTSINTLQKLNGITNPNRIRVGMVLKLPT